MWQPDLILQRKMEDRISETLKTTSSLTSSLVDDRDTRSVHKASFSMAAQKIDVDFFLLSYYLSGLCANG